MVRLTKHPRNKFGVEKFSPSKKHPTKSQCTKKTPRSKNSTCFFQQSWPEFFFPGIFPKQNKDTKRVFLRILGPIFLGKRNSRKPYGRITRRSEAGWLLCGDAVVKVRKGGPKKSHGPMAFFFFFCKMDGVWSEQLWPWNKKIGELFQVSSKIFLGFLRENRDLHLVSSHGN